MLRVEEYLTRYINGEPYEDCLLTKQSDYLKQVKKGYYSLLDARSVADTSYNNIHTLCDNFIEKNKNNPINEKINELFDNISYEIMKVSVRRDFNEKA